MYEQISSRAPFVNTDEMLEVGSISAINDKIVNASARLWCVERIKGFSTA